MAHQSWIGRLGTLVGLMLVAAGVAYGVAIAAAANDHHHPSPGLPACEQSPY